MFDYIVIQEFQIENHMYAIGDQVKAEHVGTLENNADLLQRVSKTPRQ